jgi:hypothetical protein
VTTRFASRVALRACFLYSLEGSSQKKSFSSAILPNRRSKSTILSSAVVDGLAMAFRFAPGRGPLGRPNQPFPYRDTHLANDKERCA